MCAISALHNLFFNNLYSHPSTHIFLRSIHYNMVAHNCRGKTKNLTAKPKLHSKNKIALVLPRVFAFAVRYLVFAVKYFAVRVLVLS